MGSQQKKTKTSKKKINQILMELLRGAWCQFWVKVAPAQTLHTDCSELGFHKSDFGLRSVFHSCPVLCVTSIIGQNKNPSSEQPLAGGEGYKVS